MGYSGLGTCISQSYGNYADSAIFAIFFRSIFKCYSSEVCRPIDFKFCVRHPGEGCYYNVMEIMLIEHIVSSFFQPNVVHGLINFTFYVGHPGEGLYQSYGNDADAAILSAECQGPWPLVRHF